MRELWILWVLGSVGAVVGWTTEKCPLMKIWKEARQQFRCDYRYDDDVEGWLKFHDVPATWHDARLMCHLEGTTLASPLNELLQEAMLYSARQFDPLVFKDIFTGLHAAFSNEDYYSVEGVPLSEITQTLEPGQLYTQNSERCLILTIDGVLTVERCDVPHPFVCYKADDGAKLDRKQFDECGTVDYDYHYNSITGSCYKFHRLARTWSRAHMTCAAEGGYLAIINSDDEADILENIFMENPPRSMVGKFWKQAAFIGFRDWGEHGEFLTINGQTLTEAGYDKFSEGEPNNATTGEFCGSINRNGFLNDLNCDRTHAFICEKHPSSLLCDENYSKK